MSAFDNVKHWMKTNYAADCAAFSIPCDQSTKEHKCPLCGKAKFRVRMTGATAGTYICTCGVKGCGFGILDLIARKELGASSDERVSGCNVQRVLSARFSARTERTRCYLDKGDVFVVVAIDRLGRDAVDVLTTVKTLADKGVKVVSLQEGFNLSTPAGKMMLHMMAGFAEMEKVSSPNAVMPGSLAQRQRACIVVALNSNTVI